MEKTKKILLIALLTSSILIVFNNSAYSQETERKILREYVSKDEIVSIAQTTPFDKALIVLSDVSRKFLGKVIIDPAKRTNPIGIDIRGMHWQDAFELILKVNNLWYTEYQDYIEVTGAKGEQVTEKGPVGVRFEKEPVTISSREIKISAVFFNVDLNKLHESGVNWSIFRSKPDDKFQSLMIDQQTIRKVTDTTVFNATLKGLDLSFGNLDAIVRLFSESNIGEVISNPQIVVRSSEKGRIQVGEDISVKKKDFAGNTVIEQIPTGTIIEVTPYVIREGDNEFVYLDLDVERSVITALGEAPTISRTKAKTVLLMLDGEEAVIGGLYSNFDSKVRSGVPILKDLPWWVFGLRYIFGYDKVMTTKKELTILLKVELVPSLPERITRKIRENPIEKQREKFERDLERYRTK
ncbi:MAG: putative general (Type II) secretion pathway (GSP) D protein [Ignavibacteriae bacterium]|nr:MAG: putative general (Type II) secretion pathway (GSP) D protein [Ignavibacteriota bacterium]